MLTLLFQFRKAVLHLRPGFFQIFLLCLKLCRLLIQLILTGDNLLIAAAELTFGVGLFRLEFFVILVVLFLTVGYFFFRIADDLFIAALGLPVGGSLNVFFGLVDQIFVFIGIDWITFRKAKENGRVVVGIESASRI